MSAPIPLTATPSADLDWRSDGAPVSQKFGDIYFSTDGGASEARTVFLSACGLPEAWLNRSRFLIGELGFGTGLNFLATWQLWNQSLSDVPPTKKDLDLSLASRRLHFVSIEKYPLSKDELKRALRAWPQFQSLSERLVAQWPDQVKGVHRLELSDNVTLTLYFEDVERALGAMAFQADCWFLDGFSPAQNPAMWSNSVLSRVGSLSRPGARLSTFSVAGKVREGLQKAGFDVSKHDGFGRKRHRLEAVFVGFKDSQVTRDSEDTKDNKNCEDKTRVSPELYLPKASFLPKPSASCPSGPVRPLIIGAGIAGASLARACIRRGIRPVVISDDPAGERMASGNPAAIIKPRLDLQDRPESRFFLSGYLYALRIIHALSEEGRTGVSPILQRGVIHRAHDEKEVMRFEKLMSQNALPADHMRLTQGPYGQKALYFPKAIIINPALLLEAFLQGTEHIHARITRFEKTKTGWQVYDKDGKSIGQGTHLILSVGAGLFPLTCTRGFGLRVRRGQISFAKREDMNLKPINYGGYIIPLEDHILVGATHNDAGEAPYALRPEDDRENLDGFYDVSGQRFVQSERSSRASLRVTTSNTLPLATRKAEGYFILSGLGTRGFTYAPLLADRLISDICGEPSPLGRDAEMRFEAREKPNLKAHG